MNTGFPAPRQKVWEALNDPEILNASAFRAARSIEKLSDTEMTAKVVGQGRAGLGALRRQGDAQRSRSAQRLPDQRRRQRRRRRLRQGRRHGEARRRRHGGTLLTYTVEAQVGGKLAQIGSRLIDGDRAQDGRRFLQPLQRRGRRAPRRARGGTPLHPRPRAPAAAPASLPTPSAPARRRPACRLPPLGAGSPGWSSSLRSSSRSFADVSGCTIGFRADA